MLDDVELEFECSEPLFDVVQFAGEAFLFALELVEVDCSGVVGFKELGPFVEGAPLAGDELLPLGAGILS